MLLYRPPCKPGASCIPLSGSPAAAYLCMRCRLENMTQTLYSNPDLQLPAQCDPPNITRDGKCKAVPYFVNVLREKTLFTMESTVKSTANFLLNYKVQSSLL